MLNSVLFFGIFNFFFLVIIGVDIFCFRIYDSEVISGSTFLNIAGYFFCLARAAEFFPSLDETLVPGTSSALVMSSSGMFCFLGS